jgi:hypothetical protein
MMIMLRRLYHKYPVLSVCAAVGIAAALVILAHRFDVERKYQTVEITVDSDDWTTLARRTAMNRDGLYAALYARGVRSVTLYAASLRRLADAGLVSFITGTDAIDAARTGSLGAPLAGLLRAGRIHPDNTYVMGPLPMLRFVQFGFAVQIGAARTAVLSGSGPVLEIGGRGRDLEDASLGVLPEDIEAVQAQHLSPEIRVRNFRDVAPGGMDAFFAGLRTFEQPFTFIFDRDQVLGYDQLIPGVAAAMKQDGYTFGRIEAFSARRRQKGEDVLARLVMPAVIRVFSMTPEELAGSSPVVARDKFVLAARERNIRILYIRPFLATSAGVDPVQTNLDYVQSIADELTHAGYKLGKAAPLPVMGGPGSGVLFLLAGLGTLAVAAITAGEVGGAIGAPLSARSLGAGVAVGVLLTAAAVALRHPTLWRQVLAFVAALAFPTLSMFYLVPGARPPQRAAERPERISGRRVLLHSVAGLWAVSAVTAVGGIMLAAPLSEWQFMMEMRVFLGVKLAHIIPVALIGLLIAAAGAPPGRLWAQLRAWLRQPLRLEYGIAIIVVGMLAVFALGRTGNTNLPLASSLELKSRVLLQHVLVARPRTKEYLIGHPALILTFALAMLGARRWILPAAMVGAIGQVGLINSFSHIHTPLIYVLLRTVYALVIGSLIGAALVGVVLAMRRRRPSREPERETLLQAARGAPAGSR